jgi:hypothetical protein
MTNNLAGPGEIIGALGKQRVVMGLVFAGGKRDGTSSGLRARPDCPCWPHPLASWKGRSLLD